MHKIKAMLRAELDSMESKKDLTRADIENIHLITDTIKNIDKISMLEEKQEDEIPIKSALKDMMECYGLTQNDVEKVVKNLYV